MADNLFDMFDEDDDLGLYDKERVQAAQEQKDHAEFLHHFYNTFLTSPSGEIMLKWFLRETHVFDEIFTGNRKIDFLAGRRSIGLELIRFMNEIAGVEDIVDLMNFINKNVNLNPARVARGAKQ